MEGKNEKCNLTTGQSVTIGVGAALTAMAVVGGVYLGKKLYKKAQEEDWGEKLKEKASARRAKRAVEEAEE